MRGLGDERRETLVLEKGAPRGCRQPLAAHLGRRLLLATDLTAASRSAEERAMQLAEKAHASLLVLAIVPKKGALQHSAAGRLQGRTRLADRRGIDAVGRLVDGDPAACILNAAASDGADAIVMPGHWASAPDCPCGRVVLHARCPVLVTNTP
jgi:nucleotide-binding universal stress UspA family protein